MVEGMLLRAGLVFVLTLVLGIHAQNYLVGRGIADVTGAAADGILYGYGSPGQDARGLHLRQYSRAFVVAAPDDSSRVAVVSVEVTMISQAVKTEVVELLTQRFGGLYTYSNVLLSPTHSHSLPGGYHTYFMYNVPNDGLVPETYRPLVDGIVRSIELAHADLRPGDVYVNTGELLDANINRSPYGYDQNPQEERDRYSDNVDKDMTVLKLVDVNGEDMGMLSFFAVHTTSMKRTNRLLSGDNKGYAAQEFEKQFNPGSHPGQATIIGAFVQTTEGDASPNLQGARCSDTGELCFYNTSTCPSDPTDGSRCHGIGPAGEHFEDTRIIGDRQFQKARGLYESASEKLSGPVDSRHQFVNMSAVVVDTSEGPKQLCRPAMGFSFGAGATDGPGGLWQGMLPGSDPELEELVATLFDPSDEIMACHDPKPILLPSGEMDPEVWPWQPEIVPLQLIRVGDIVLVGNSAEVTTMAGRRIVEAVRQSMISAGQPTTIRPLVLAMSNGYSSYLVTPEEYTVQRYEAASNIYGINALDGYLQLYTQMAQALANGSSVTPGTLPPDLREKPGFIEPVVTDITPEGLNFGDVLVDAADTYTQGETVSVTFVAGNPRNNPMTDSTFLEVQERGGGPDWSTEFTDAHWETKFHWISNCHDVIDLMCDTNVISNATITWDIPANQRLGQYRIMYHGHSKNEDGTVSEHHGESSHFQVQQQS